jgi:hypothetical protein
MRFAGLIHIRNGIVYAMGRPAPDGAPREVLIQVKVTQAGADELDRLRGQLSRPDYIRKLMKDDSARDRANRAPAVMKLDRV